MFNNSGIIEQNNHNYNRDRGQRIDDLFAHVDALQAADDELQFDNDSSSRQFDQNNNLISNEDDDLAELRAFDMHM